MRFRLTLLIVCAAPLAARAATERPNIIIIMSDDMGFSDIGCYGGEIKTPTLDGLAAQGLRFTQFYNTGRCCPTRASLITGLYPHQAGVGHMMDDSRLPGYTGNLNKNCRTLAEVLRTAGYGTYMSGKWHVTRHTANDGPKFNWPLQRGFDRFFGTIHGAGSFYDPNSLTRDNTQIPPGEGFFYTDAINDHAATYISDHAKNHADRPFFIYVAHTAAHWPMHAHPRDIAKYSGAYDEGWGALRAARHARMIKMGLVKEEWPISPRDPRAPKWEDEEYQEWNVRCMEVYAAMVDCMDQGIGRIMDTLKTTNQYDNTLVFFLQDNGGCAEGMGRQTTIHYRDGDPDKLKPMKPGALQTEMIPRRTRDGHVVKQGRGVMPGPADTYIGYGLPWANASNTPFREYKHWVHEGGISTPLIAHWPSGISADQRGRLEHQPGHLIDLMATCIDLSGATYPREVDGHQIVPFQGVSLRPAFEGKRLGRSEPIFWEHEGNRAMREGKWKLVAKGARGPWELYDMEVDRTELNNLAASQPERTARMAQRWEAWAVEAKVKPWKWDRQKNKKKPAKNARG